MKKRTLPCSNLSITLRAPSLAIAVPPAALRQLRTSGNARGARRGTASPPDGLKSCNRPVQWIIGMDITVPVSVLHCFTASGRIFFMARAKMPIRAQRAASH